MRVITGSKDLAFRIKGRLVTHDKSVNVTMTHDIEMKLRDGSLKEVPEKVKPPKTEIIKPAPKPEPKPEPKKS